MRLMAVGFMMMAVGAGMRTEAQVLQGPQGPVEFVGVSRWTSQQLFDTIRALDPDMPFHACAIIMKRQLGFPDAAAMGFLTEVPDEVHIVVVGVEDPSGVRYRTPGTRSVPVSEPMADLVERASEGVGHLTGPARSLGLATTDPDRARALAERWGAPTETIEEDWHALRRVAGSTDLSALHHILRADSAWAKRGAAVAAAWVAPRDPRAWHLLVAGLIDPDVATRIDSDLALRLARREPELLLAYAVSAHPGIREPAAAFLAIATGEDNLEDWQSALGVR